MSDSYSHSFTLSSEDNPLKAFCDRKIKFELEMKNALRELKPLNRAPINSNAIRNYSYTLACQFEDMRFYYNIADQKQMTGYSERCEFECFKKWWHAVRDDINAALSSNPVPCSMPGSSDVAIWNWYHAGLPAPSCQSLHSICRYLSYRN